MRLRYVFFSDENYRRTIDLKLITDQLFQFIAITKFTFTHTVTLVFILIQFGAVLF